jgi:hypothetical protein
MADLELSFNGVQERDQIAFVEGELGIGETTIEVDTGGEVRLCAVAFGAGFEGASITVKQEVPWSAGAADHTINELTITPVAGEIVALDYADWYWPGKVTFTVNTGQTAAHDIGFFGWRGRVQ